MLKRKHFPFLMLSTLFIFEPTFADVPIYESTSPDGTLSFSDIPTANSSIYSLRGSNVSSFDSTSDNLNNTTTTSPTSLEPTQVANQAANTNPALASANTTTSNTYSSIEVTSPSDQQTFQNQNPIPVSIVVQPPLQNGDKVQLLLDGAPYGPPQASTQLSINGDIPRGTHQVQARIIAANGQSQNVSPAVTFFKQQASILLHNTSPPMQPVSPTMQPVSPAMQPLNKASS
ncbi:MAG: uncharacterized protein K0S08_1722 [Gammaproteobacteria bacterium]|jgi:hypothetical protein|nr:uncharacterized protein [Gammaproteobacteria bacterium]